MVDAKVLENILHVRKIEEIDVGGDLISVIDRVEASRAAGIPQLPSGEEKGLTRDEEVALEKRAERIAERLGLPEQSGGGTGRRLVWLGLALVFAALLLGFGANRLANVREFNILSPPFLGIILWNLIVFIILLGSGLRGFFMKKEEKGGWLSRLCFSRWSAGKETPPAEDLRGAASLSHRLEWEAIRLPARLHEGVAWFHLAAAAVAIGALGSLYLTGLVREYRAIWESTFLGLEQGEVLAGFIFGPALAVSGINTGNFSLLAAEGGAPAAPWIHLAAWTLGLFVILPRIVLAILSWVRSSVAMKRSCGHAANDLAPYFQQLRRRASGRTKKVIVAPYASSIGEDYREGLENAAEELWDERVGLEIADPVAYGAEDEFLQEQDLSSGALLVFPMTATPEDEAHGYLMRGCLEGSAGAPVFAALDTTSFDRKFSGLPEFAERREQRLRVWGEVLSKAGASVPLTLVAGGDVDGRL